MSTGTADETFGCEHDFAQGGVVYEVDERPVAGTSARNRFYYDYFYCRKCLAPRYIRLKYTDDTYSKISFDAKPKQIQP